MDGESDRRKPRRSLNGEGEEQGEEDIVVERNGHDGDDGVVRIESWCGCLPSLNFCSNLNSSSYSRLGAPAKRIRAKRTRRTRRRTGRRRKRKTKNYGFKEESDSDDEGTDLSGKGAYFSEELEQGSSVREAYEVPEEHAEYAQKQDPYREHAGADIDRPLEADHHGNNDGNTNNTNNNNNNSSEKKNGGFGSSSGSNRSTSGNNEATEIARVKQYTLARVLGSGSQGHVRLAVDDDFKRWAVKIVKKRAVFKRGKVGKYGTATGQVAREIAVMKKLSHPNLVALKEVLDDPNERQLFLVMELVAGGPVMDDRLVGQKPLPEDTSRHYFRQLLSAVEYLHFHGIVHRDIKPSNLLVDKQRDLVKLSDFGVSMICEPVADASDVAIDRAVDRTRPSHIHSGNYKNHLPRKRDLQHSQDQQQQQQQPQPQQQPQKLQHPQQQFMAQTHVKTSLRIGDRSSSSSSSSSNSSSGGSDNSSDDVDVDANDDAENSVTAKDDIIQKTNRRKSAMPDKDKVAFDGGNDHVQCQSCSSLNSSEAPVCWACDAELSAVQGDCAPAMPSNFRQLDGTEQEAERGVRHKQGAKEGANGTEKEGYSTWTVADVDDLALTNDDDVANSNVLNSSHLPSPPLPPFEGAGSLDDDTHSPGNSPMMASPTSLLASNYGSSGKTKTSSAPRRERKQRKWKGDQAGTNTHNDIIDSRMGTYAFFPPEACAQEGDKLQYQGKVADMWAVGVTLYMFLFGQVPFPAETEEELFRRIRNDPLDFPVHSDLDVKPASSEAVKLLKQILRKKPSKRLPLWKIKKSAWVRKGVGAMPPLSKSQAAGISVTERDMASALTHVDLSVAVRLMVRSKSWSSKTQEQVKSNLAVREEIERRRLIKSKSSSMESYSSSHANSSAQSKSKLNHGESNDSSVVGDLQLDMEASTLPSMETYRASTVPVRQLRPEGGLTSELAQQYLPAKTPSRIFEKAAVARNGDSADQEEHDNSQEEASVSAEELL